MEKRENAAHAALQELGEEEEKLAESIEAAQKDANAVRQKIAMWEQRLHQKEEAAAKLEAKRAQIAAQREEKALELQALNERRAQLDAQKLFRAFQSSGKSMDELLAFLGCTAEQAVQLENEAELDEQPGDKPSPPPAPKAKRRRTRQRFDPAWEPEFHALWQKIEQAQGEPFATARGLPFCYEVRGHQLFVDRKEKPISESSLKIAFMRAKTCPVDGPKALQTFGAPYIWGIFKKLGVVLGEADGQQALPEQEAPAASAPLQQHDGCAVDHSAE